jgi:pre-mRNA-splicing factor CWC26
MSLSAYLAKNYLNASASPSDLSTRPKKRRKKDPSASDGNSGLVIADDDLLLSVKISNALKDDDEDGPLLDSNSRSAEFRRSKKNNWKTVGVAAPTDSEQVEADRILAAAAEESTRARAEVDAEDAPAVVEDAGVGQMSSGARAGLQTAADTEAMVLEAQRRKDAEMKAAKLNKKRNKGQPDQAEETVYRDATGRRIDVSMKRAEARAAELEKLRQELKEKEDAMGEVQKRQKEERKEKLEEAKFLTVARHADDEEMNEELKGAIRWDDPMAAYMMKKQEEEGGGGRGRATGKSFTEGDGGGREGTGRKVYQGAAPPNRYGIKPGWRWDGVDRSNGFEKEWFQARGRKARNENLDYQWQMDE